MSTMPKLPLANTGLKSSRLIYGCMRITGEGSAADLAKGKQALHAAVDAGYNHFDHADIYGAGQCESLFGEFLSEMPSMRDKLIVTSKAGIRRAGQPNELDPMRYDFSKDYLVNSVEGSLTRLKTDYLDTFLLHRPDYLMDVEQVAEAFYQLKLSGKVRHFGVSNFTPSQLSLLASALDMPLTINQVEINLHNISTLQDGTLDQCQQHNIAPMAWCPLGGVVYSAWGNQFSVDDERRLEVELDKQAQKYQVERWHIALAWLLIHPAKIFPLIGSTNADRIAAATKALEIPYTREDWYQLFEARNGVRVP